MRNKYLKFVFTILVAGLLVGCGKDEAEQPVVSEEIEEDSSESEEAAEEDSEADSDEVSLVFSNSDNAEWARAYMDFINELPDPDCYSYDLVYIDDDVIPELWVDFEVEAGGECVATYYDGKVVDYDLPRIGSQYIPKGGYIYTSTGHMDYYPVQITKLENGKFTEVAQGVFYMSQENMQILAEGNYEGTYEDLLSYEWEDKPVTVEEFYANIAEYLDMDNLVYPTKNGGWRYDEVIKKLAEK